MILSENKLNSDDDIVDIVQVIDEDKEINQELDECIICLENIEFNNVNSFIRPCSNCKNSFYHVKCFEKMVHSNFLFCPTCRTEFNLYHENNDKSVNIKNNNNQNVVISNEIIEIDRQNDFILTNQVLMNQIRNIISNNSTYDINEVINNIERQRYITQQEERRLQIQTQIRQRQNNSNNLTYDDFIFSCFSCLFVTLMPIIIVVISKLGK